MNLIKLDIGGEIVSGYLLKDGTNYWLHVNGRAFYIEEESSRSGKKAVQAADPGKIVAPMPGRIIKVTHSVGTTVKAGEVLVVLEAMKMEYSLKTEVHGTIKAVHCREGDQVTLGKTLLQLEEQKD